MFFFLIGRQKYTLYLGCSHSMRIRYTLHHTAPITCDLTSSIVFNGWIRCHSVQEWLPSIEGPGFFLFLPCIILRTYILSIKKYFNIQREFFFCRNTLITYFFFSFFFFFWEFYFQLVKYNDDRKQKNFEHLWFWWFW